jgi:hypothetical protein
MKISEAQSILSRNEANGEGTLMVLNHVKSFTWKAKNLYTDQLVRVQFGKDVYGNVVVEDIYPQPVKETKPQGSCGANCRTAKSEECTCTCYGANHGTEAGPVAHAVRNLPSLGTVRIGRNILPARQFSDGTVERNTRTDGTGSWVPATSGVRNF